MQGWRTQFADARATDWYRPDLWPDFRAHHLRSASCCCRALVYLASFVALYGFSLPDLIEAQRRIFSDNTTSRDRGPHLYELVAVLAVPGAAGLVSVRQARRRRHLGGGVSRQSAGAVAGAARGLAVCVRDFIVARRADAFLVAGVLSRALARLGAAAAHLGFLYYYLPSATTASLVLVYALRREGMPRWLLWAFVAVAAAGLCGDAADFGGFRRHVDADLQPLDDLPELDLTRAAASGNLRGRLTPFAGLVNLTGQGKFEFTALNRKRPPCGPSSSAYWIRRRYPRMGSACYGNRS